MKLIVPILTGIAVALMAAAMYSGVAMAAAVDDSLSAPDAGLADARTPWQAPEPADAKRGPREDSKDGSRVISLAQVKRFAAVYDSRSGRHSVVIDIRLPDYCHEFHEAAVAQRGGMITIEVFQSEPHPDEGVFCAQAERTHTHRADLQRIIPGRTYWIEVNGEVIIYTAPSKR